MSQTLQMQTLFAFHWHTVGRLMDCAAELDDADYRAQPGYGRGSIHDLLFHVLRAERGWRIALESGRQQAGVQPEDFPTLEALRAGFVEEQAAWDRVLAGLDDTALETDVTLINWRGDAWVLPRWRVLQHLTLHAMQHETEIAQLLTVKGRSPGDIDFIFYQPT